ncbi:MAG: serine/threonine-protein kinase, partial [Acidobacteriota bacterium]
LGPYRIEAVLGRGGSAIVYTARGVAGPDSRPVAIKVLGQGAAREVDLRRIQREGEILAKLRHPNIARIYGGGLDADGRPYLVMELVEGEPIHRYCRRLRLTVQERLRLLLPLFSAVRYAHANLIVHRDLKPENILVTADGTVKVLDFGISKQLEPSADSPGTVTALGLHMMTPEYAAPEQLSLAPMTTAVDIYALGVVVYELLTDRRPFERSDDPNGFILRVLTEEIPPLSSWYRESAAGVRERSENRSASRRRIARALRSDLDPVAATALAKDPSARYPSVEAFGQDLGRVLDNRPVEARRGRVGYRLRKAFRRHRRELAAAAIVLIAAIVWLVDREASRRQIVAERNKATIVRDYMVDFFADFDPYNRESGGPATIEELVESSLDRQRLDEVPIFKASLLRTLSTIEGNRGHYERSTTLMREALRIFRHHLPVSDPRIAQAEVALADRLLFAGDTAAAARTIDAALVSYAALDQPSPFEVAEARFSKARILYGERRLDDASVALHEVGGLIADLPDDVHSRSLGFEVRIIRSYVARETGDLAEAEALLSELWSDISVEWGPDDARCLYVLGDLGQARLQLGQHAEGLADLRQVVDGTRRVQGEHRDLGRALLWLGRALHDVGGQTDAAQAALEEAISVLTATVGEDNALTRDAQALLDEVLTG